MKPAKGRGQEQATKEPAPPRLPRAFRELTAEQVEAEGTYRGMSLTRLDLAGHSAHALAFEGCVFREVNLRGATWESLRLADVRFEGCDLSGAHWPEAGLTRAAFDGCRMLGTQLPEARLRHVRLTGVQARLSLWYRADTAGLWAEECDFGESSWLEAKLPAAVLRRCRLGRADLLGSVLEGADLRGSELAGLRVGLRELAGATVEAAQLLDLAHLLGVRVAQLDTP